eukprot:2517295-Amphidinium_carterae.1
MEEYKLLQAIQVNLLHGWHPEVHPPIQRKIVRCHSSIKKIPIKADEEATIAQLEVQQLKILADILHRRSFTWRPNAAYCQMLLQEIEILRIA